MEKKKFTITRIITRDIVTDLFQGIRNFFGLRLRGYETRIQKNLQEMIQEMEIKYSVDWFRFEINPARADSFMIVLYGEGKVNE